MPQDIYEREDNRTLCDRIGHRYKEISSKEKRWSVLEDSVISRERYSPWGEDEGANPDGDITTRTRVHYRADLVTYKCTNCGDEVIKTENESSE